MLHLRDLLLCATLALPLCAQPAFEVISIKPVSVSGPHPIGFDIQPGGRLHAVNVPLIMIISAAYDVPFQSARVTGLPDWATGQAYDIDAVPEKGAIPPADRFKLVMRTEKKELPIYAVTVAKGGLKLKAAAMQEKDCGPTAACHDMHGGMGRGMHSQAADIDDIALFASNWTDRPLVNRTGLAGLFEVDTEGWAPMQPRQPRADGGPDPEAEALADPSHPTVFMIFSRMGLKVEAQKGLLDMYVVESVQQPVAN